MVLLFSLVTIKCKCFWYIFVPCIGDYLVGLFDSVARGVYVFLTYGT